MKSECVCVYVRVCVSVCVRTGGSERAGGGGPGRRLRGADGWGGVVAGVQSLRANTACCHKHNRHMKKKGRRRGEGPTGEGGEAAALARASAAPTAGGPFGLLALM